MQEQRVVSRVGDGKLSIPLPESFNHHRVEVIVRTLDEDVKPPGPRGEPTDESPAPILTGDSVVDHFQPQTELGRRLIALRRAHVEAGGKLLSWDEIDGLGHGTR
jgi:hypothetical protein